MPVRTVILNCLRIHPAYLGKMTSFTLSISIPSSRNMKPRSHFSGLTSIELPMKRDVIFDQNFPSYHSIDFNQTTTEKRTWYKSWFPFDLKRDPMSKMAVIQNCFTVKLSNSPLSAIQRNFERPAQSTTLSIEARLELLPRVRHSGLKETNQ